MIKLVKQFGIGEFVGVCVADSEYVRDNQEAEEKKPILLFLAHGHWIVGFSKEFMDNQSGELEWIDNKEASRAAKTLKNRRPDMSHIPQVKNQGDCGPDAFRLALKAIASTHEIQVPTF